MHFTYLTPDLGELRQGDILQKTPALLELIRTVHPHYAGDEYLYFQVLTQSCDLVRRSNGECKSRYITLAAVRKLDLIVRRAIERFPEKQEFDNKLFCSDKHKRALQDFLNKIFNNNDTQHFYLQAEPDYGLIFDCCTQLHLSISIRAYEHYEVCLDAKILELCENFRAKLGWLVGNLYSRVGTEDYVPGAIPDEETYLSFIEAKMNNYVAWIPETDFSTFKKATKRAANFDEARSFIGEEKARARESKLDQIVNAIAKGLQMEEAQKSALKNVIGQHPIMQKALGK